MSLKRILTNPFVIATIVYLFLIVLINPIGEFAINDDWAYLRQVEHGVDGTPRISSIIDPSFISQNLLGIVWSKIFGVSFSSLRILTICVTIFMAWGIYRFFRLFEVGDYIILVSLLLTYFNPLVFTSSMSFMGEIYVLVGFIWSIYFYIKGFKGNSPKYFLFGSLFVGFALLVKQSGIVLFIAFFLISPFITVKKRERWKILMPNFLIFILSFLVMSLWPRYTNADQGNSIPGLKSLMGNLIEPKYMGRKLRLMMYSLPYFAFFIFPFLISVKTKLSRWVQTIGIFLVIFFSYQIFKLDTFAVGSVFYIEELYAKSNYKFNLSLFNNIPFKLFVSFITGFSFVKLLILPFGRIKRSVGKGFIKENIVQIFLALVALGAFFINFFANDYYERYFLPSFFALFMFFIILMRERLGNRKVLTELGVFLMIFISFTLQFEYFQHTRIRWKHANGLQDKTGLVNGIFVDGVYAKYYNSKKSNDYTGSAVRGGATEYKCYVQKYTFDTNSKVLEAFNFIENKLEKVLDNPRIYNSRKPQGLPSAKKHLDELIYEDEYFSILYSIIGKRAFVGSWCDREFLDKIQSVN